MTKEQNKKQEEVKEGENILKSRPANPFERDEQDLKEEADSVKKASGVEKSKSSTNPTLEALMGAAPREAKMDRKERLKEFLKENRKRKKEETKTENKSE